jgi:hypothetical protein
MLHKEHNREQTVPGKRSLSPQFHPNKVQRPDEQKNRK